MLAPLETPQKVSKGEELKVNKDLFLQKITPHGKGWYVLQLHRASSTTTLAKRAKRGMMMISMVLVTISNIIFLNFSTSVIKKIITKSYNN